MTRLALEVAVVAAALAVGAIWEHLRAGGSWDWRHAYLTLERQQGMDAMRRARQLIDRGLIR